MNEKNYIKWLFIRIGSHIETKTGGGGNKEGNIILAENLFELFGSS